jgi:hypothetical protein
VQGRLIDLAGGSAGQVAIAVDSRGPGAFAGQEQLDARLVATGAAAGSYTLEVTVTDPAGSALTSSIPVVMAASG